MLLQPGAQRLAGNRKQGARKLRTIPLETGSHGCQPSHAGAPAQRQQDAFRLVIGIVTQQYCGRTGCQGRLRERAVAFLPRPGFHTIASGEHNAQRQFHVFQRATGLRRRFAQDRACLFTMAGKGVGARLQPMVHMQCHDRLWQAVR